VYKLAGKLRFAYPTKTGGSSYLYLPYRSDIAGSEACGQSSQLIPAAYEKAVAPERHA